MVPGTGELVAEVFGQGGDGAEVVGPMLVKCLGKLAGAVGGSGKLLEQVAKLLILKAKKRMHRLGLRERLK